ncbi:MAG: peptide chain release factor N(5)-glutamine methyltransferase [Thermodesulfobacteriota bacterium]
MKVRELYNQTVSRLRQVNIPDDALEAEFLLRFALGLSRVELFLDERQLSRSELDKLESLLLRRLGREPLAYIIGEQEFWSLSFEVSPAVLIPRPETELLIENVLSLVDNPTTFSGQVLELGVGSGIITVVLALELAGAELVAVDLSPQALEVAARNIERHGVAERVVLVNGDWFCPLAPESKFDFIVSNPPYVAGQARDNLQPELDFEPGLALYADDSGMAAYQRIIPACNQYLKPGGYVLCEIGGEQEEMIHKLFMAAPNLELREIVKDYAGLPRVALAQAVDGTGGRR